MEVTMTELAVWIIVGALAGSLAGMVVMRRKLNACGVPIVCYPTGDAAITQWSANPVRR